MRVLNELITKEDAINAVNRYRTSIMDTKRAIYALPSAQQWISVSERLPEEEDYHKFNGQPDGAVIWCKSDGEIGVGWYYISTKTWVDCYDKHVQNVVAWMPLPKPYRPESEYKE